MSIRLIKGSLHKPSKNVLMFVLSLVIGGIGVFYSKRYIESEIAMFKQSLDVVEKTVEVVVPNRDMIRGELVSQDDLVLREIPAQYVDSNSVISSTFETALGQRVRFNLDVGKPLLWAHLESGQTLTFSGKVPTGLRAMTIRVDEINSISGFLQPGDRIDLLLTHGDNSSKQIFPLIQNLNVIATGVQTYVKEQNSVQRAFNTITIQVTPEQAKKITLSQQVGKITAMLRNPDDESPLSKKPMNIAQVLNLPDQAKRTKLSNKPKPGKLKPSIEYIIGGT